MACKMACKWHYVLVLSRHVPSWSELKSTNIALHFCFWVGPSLYQDCNLSAFGLLLSGWNYSSAICYCGFNILFPHSKRV